MTEIDATVVRPDDARQFMEGPELCREYFRNQNMWFGTSTLAPGEVGAVDVGHPVSVEIYYCAAGTASVKLDDTHHALAPGDALVIPPGEPHTISNVGDDTVTIVWAGAPGD
jgi:mannose-6-phosphate isomerase-like protein (cupin superfamily)